MNRSTRPTIARRCPMVWTAADERAMRASMELLAADIRAAGGLTAWLDVGIEEWLRRDLCPARLS